MKNMLIISILICLLIISVGCTIGGGSAKKMSEKNNSHQMSAEYTDFSGYRKTKVKLSQDEEKVINVNIVNEKGDISLKITDKDGGIFYQGDKMGTSNFTLTLNKEGEYTMRIDTKKHSGSYDISW